MSSFAVLDALRCHVEAALKAHGCSEVARSFVAAGQVAWDDCNQLSVATGGRWYRTVQFPLEYTGDEMCWSGDLAVPIAVQLTRCAPVPGEGRIDVQAQALTEHAASVYHDADVIWNALAGALPNDEWTRAGLTSEIVGPQGGMLAIVHRFTLGLEADDWCVE